MGLGDKRRRDDLLILGNSGVAVWSLTTLQVEMAIATASGDKMAIENQLRRIAAQKKGINRQGKGRLLPAWPWE